MLFLFLVGLEVDFTQFRKNAKVSASVSFVGLALPFALGCCVSVGLYKEFIDPETKFTHFMLFIGAHTALATHRVTMDSDSSASQARACPSLVRSQRCSSGLATRIYTCTSAFPVLARILGELELLQDKVVSSL